MHRLIAIYLSNPNLSKCNPIPVFQPSLRDIAAIIEHREDKEIAPCPPIRFNFKKVPFIAAVQTTEDKRPVATHLRRVSGFRKTALAHYADTSLEAGSIVWSDGLACFEAVADAGCMHMPLVKGGGRTSAKHPTFKWVNTMLGNVKNAITGTYYGTSTKHAPRYLAEFEYRFNLNSSVKP